MRENGTQVRKLLRQQAAVAHFGSFALREGDVLKVLTEAARVCAECLSVPFSKVCRYREQENDLLIEAGSRLAPRCDWKCRLAGRHNLTAGAGFYHREAIDLQRFARRQ
jgi:hypothetical protein